MKLTKLVLSITFLVLALNLFSNPILGVQVAGKKGGIPSKVINFPVEQRIRPGATISASQESMLGLARGQTETQKDLELYCQPMKVRVLFDGEEVLMKRFAWNDKDGELAFPGNPGGEPIKWKVFYHFFEPGYFEPGFHTFGIEWLWYEGYGYYYDGGEIAFRHFEYRSFQNLPFWVV
jgi:hypothetical protein